MPGHRSDERVGHVRHRTDSGRARAQACAMSIPMPSAEQRVYDAADNAYLSEGGYLAPIGNDLAQAADDTAAVGPRRGNGPAPRAGSLPAALAPAGRFGVVRSGRVCRYAKRRHGHLCDAFVRAWTAARPPH